MVINHLAFPSNGHQLSEIGSTSFRAVVSIIITSTQNKNTRVAVMRLSSVRRLVNPLPVAQWTNALTNGVVDKPWVVGREFESHVHHENAF